MLYYIEVHQGQLDRIGQAIVTLAQNASGQTQIEVAYPDRPSFVTGELSASDFPSDDYAVASEVADEANTDRLEEAVDNVRALLVYASAHTHSKAIDGTLSLEEVNEA